MFFYFWRVHRKVAAAAVGFPCKYRAHDFTDSVLHNCIGWHPVVVSDRRWSRIAESEGPGPSAPSTPWSKTGLKPDKELIIHVIFSDGTNQSSASISELVAVECIDLNG